MLAAAEIISDNRMRSNKHNDRVENSSEWWDSIQTASQPEDDTKLYSQVHPEPILSEERDEAGTSSYLSLNTQ